MEFSYLWSLVALISVNAGSNCVGGTIEIKITGSGIRNCSCANILFYLQLRRMQEMIAQMQAQMKSQS